MPGTDLAVMDRVTGEVLALKDATDEQLATVLDHLTEHRGTLTDEEDRVRAELLARLDRAASWTRRVGDPEVAQWEFTAPSPDAGTEAFDAVLLESEARALVARDVVDTAAAAGAMKREVSVTFGVPLDADLDEIVARLKAPDAQVQVAGVDVRVLKASTTRAAHLPGIKRLRKVPGTAEALKRAQLPPVKPARRVAVKRITPS